MTAKDVTKSNSNGTGKWRVLIVQIVFGVWTIAIIPAVTWAWSMSMWRAETSVTRFTSEDAKEMWKVINDKVDKDKKTAPEVSQSLIRMENTLLRLSKDVQYLREEVAAIKARNP